MAGISDEDIRRVREASDLVAIAGERVVLKQRGRDFWGCCPFHGEKSPSFKIDPTTQLWHCFGCGEGGDVFSFVMKLDDIGFLDAVRELARRAGVQITEAPGAQAARGKKARLKDVCEKTAEFYHTQLMRGRGGVVADARAYLGSRNLGGSVPATWNLGFAPGRQALVRHLTQLGFKPDEMIEANVATRSKANGSLQDRFYDRIMFPIRNVEGETIAFGGRVIGKGEPKYLNSQETPVFHKSEVLFGLDKAKASMASTGAAIIVEGYTDVIVMHEAGVTNVVATLGTALTLQHIRIISRHAKKRIVYLFDGDEAGQRAADRAARFIDESMLPEAGRSKLDLCAVTLPDNLDPADFVQQRGSRALEELIAQAQPLLRYAIDRKLAGRNLADFSEKGRALGDVLELLAPIKTSILAQQYAAYIADALMLDVTAVTERLAKTKAPRPYEPGAGAASGAQASEQQRLQPAASYAHSALPPKEKDRLRIEREFLGLCARHAGLAFEHAGVLAATVWHRDVHTAIAQAMMDFFATVDPLAVEATDVVRGVDALCPGAANVLSAGSVYDEVDPAQLAQFLAEELAMRDLEDAVLQLNAQLKNSADMSEEDRTFIYQSAAAMQNELVAMRLAHKPLGAL